MPQAVATDPLSGYCDCRPSGGFSRLARGAIGPLAAVQLSCNRSEFWPITSLMGELHWEYHVKSVWDMYFARASTNYRVAFDGKRRRSFE